MFDLNNYYELTHSGDKVDNTDILAYIKSFKHIVIWGASYLGSSIGKYLIENGIEIENYWDLRSIDLKELNGVEIIQPFTTKDTESTIVIFCIGNNIIRGGLLNNLKKLGYNSVVRGDYLYMGAVCPFDKTTGIDSQQCQGTMCCRSIFCERLSNIIKAKSKKTDPLHMYSITFVINSRCSLGCKFCTSYMNEYSREKRKDVPLERICDDIDKFLNAMDSLGTITVMGGEPFMHPDLSAIMKKLLTKDNFGLVSIATSGTYPIKLEQLEGLQDKRVNVSFSNYVETITQKQKELFYKNIEIVKNAGVSFTVGVVMPEWAVPSTLYDLGETNEQMISKKASCTIPSRCMQVKNGKLHPCDFATSIYSIGIADYEIDYVDIKNSTSNDELNKKIRAFIDQPYYHTCGHCGFGLGGLTAKAAEQGYMDFTKPLGDERRT